MDKCFLGKINECLFANNLKKDNRLEENQTLPMLGSQMGDWESEQERMDFHKNLPKDAAALCAFVYKSNPLTNSKTYKTTKNNWYLYTEDSSNSNLELFSTLKGRLRRGRTGFGSMLFYQKGNNGRIIRIAYVTEGSGSLSSLENQLEAESSIDRIKNTTRVLWDRIGDWALTNLMQGLTGFSPQHTFSIQNAKILNNICKHHDIKELYFFGHSLGGGLAVSNALATNRPAIVFDMAGLHIQRLLRYKRNYDTLLRQHNILSFYYEGEALSSIGWTLIGLKHNGNRYVIKNKETSMKDKVLMNFGLHSLDKICVSFGLEESKIIGEKV